MILNSKILQHLSLFTIYMTLKIDGNHAESRSGNPKLEIPKISIPRNRYLVVQMLLANNSINA